MNAQDMVQRRVAAAEDFDLHEHRVDGTRIITSLGAGLTILRDSLYTRIHDDLARSAGADSMLSPVSEEKTERMAKLEIELYQMAVSSVTVCARRYCSTADDWYLRWLSGFRLGPIRSDGRVAERLAYYLSRTPDERRLAFSNVLMRAMPESRRTPLVLFRLLPPAIQIVTALAFGKTADAGQWRKEQIEVQPPLGECHECRGKLVDNGEQCRICGNPLWKFEWLTMPY